MFPQPEFKVPLPPPPLSSLNLNKKLAKPSVTKGRASKDQSFEMISNKRSKKILRKRHIDESYCGLFVTDESSSSHDKIEFKKRDSSQNRNNEITPIRSLSKKFKMQ